MFRSLGIALCLATLALAGCSTTAYVSSNDECVRMDCQQMAAIEHVAETHGVDVIWVHPPYRD